MYAECLNTRIFCSVLIILLKICFQYTTLHTVDKSGLQLSTYNIAILKHNNWKVSLVTSYYRVLQFKNIEVSAFFVCFHNVVFIFLFNDLNATKKELVLIYFPYNNIKRSTNPIHLGVIVEEDVKEAASSI